MQTLLKGTQHPGSLLGSLLGSHGRHCSFLSRRHNWMKAADTTSACLATWALAALDLCCQLSSIQVPVVSLGSAYKMSPLPVPQNSMPPSGKINITAEPSHTSHHWGSLRSLGDHISHPKLSGLRIGVPKSHLKYRGVGGQCCSGQPSPA